MTNRGIGNHSVNHICISCQRRAVYHHHPQNSALFLSNLTDYSMTNHPMDQSPSSGGQFITGWENQTSRMLLLPLSDREGWFVIFLINPPYLDCLSLPTNHRCCMPIAYHASEKGKEDGEEYGCPRTTKHGQLNQRHTNDDEGSGTNLISRPRNKMYIRCDYFQWPTNQPTNYAGWQQQQKRHAASA